jgi:hypothetical protein
MHALLLESLTVVQSGLLVGLVFPSNHRFLVPLVGVHDLRVLEASVLLVMESFAIGVVLLEFLDLRVVVVLEFLDAGVLLEAITVGH